MNSPLTNGQKSDFYIMLTHMKIAADYAEFLQDDGKIVVENGEYMIAKSLNQRVKVILKDVHRFNMNLIARFRAAMPTKEGKEVFDASWKRDHLAWAKIQDLMSQMNEEGITKVELFCNALLKGEVRIELEEGKETT